MRILIFSTAYFPYVGGVEIAIKNITERLGEHTFDLITCRMSRRLPTKEKLGRVTVYRVGIGFPKIDKLVLALLGHLTGLKLWRENKYDLIWSQMASYPSFAAVRLKEKTGLKFLLTLQEGDSLRQIERKTRLVKRRFRKIFKSADGLQAISSYLLDWGRKMGFSGKTAKVIANGVDISSFSRKYDPTELSNLRKSFGFSEGSVIITTASRLVKKNGLTDAINALSLLEKRYCFYIIGEGKLEKPLKALVDKLNLQDRVVFAGFKEHKELPKYLQASDIFLRPSLTEGLGNAFLEAMASGIVTIGTLVGGISDFLVDGQTGLACRPGDIQSIARAVKRAGELTREEKEKIRQNSLKLVKEKFDWDQIVTKMDNLFKSFI